MAFIDDQHESGMVEEESISAWSRVNQFPPFGAINDYIGNAIQPPSPTHRSTERVDIPYSGFNLATDYGFDTSIYEALNIWLTPGGPANSTTWESQSPWKQTPNPTSIDQTTVEISKRVQQVWPRRRATAVVRLIRNMWRSAIKHPAANLFSCGSAAELMAQNTTGSRWNMDDICRSRLISDCERTLLTAESYSGQVTAPGSPHISTPLEHEIGVDGLSPQAPRDTFPSTEMLNMSIDLYFRRSHPVIPFVHQATFDARTTPSSLLLPICLIGLSILNPGGTEGFIRNYLGKLIQFCRLNLTYKALGKGGAQQLVTSLASALLVLYLGLSCEQLVDQHQAHMLAIQTLFIADRHGMFSACEGEAITQAMFEHLDQETQWTAWARVESLKRLVTCLISLDSAYTRMLDLAANIGVEKLEVVLPCDSALFDAPSAASFFYKIKSGIPMIASHADLSSATNFLISTLDLSGLRILLDVIALREAAARHKLLPGASSSLRIISFVPMAAYAANEKACSIAKALVAVGTTRMILVNQDAPTALTWNYLCLVLTADINRVQNACGRIGPAASQQALGELKKWAQTTSARRAILHAAQIFRVLSHYRVSDHKTLLCELVLLHAALVLAVYVGVHSPTPRQEEDSFELTSNVQWADVCDEGLTKPPSGHKNAPLLPMSQSAKFVARGGPFSFGGETYPPGAISARKLVLIFAQLFDEIFTRNESEYPKLLRTIGDFFGVAEHMISTCAGDIDMCPAHYNTSEHL